MHPIEFKILIKKSGLVLIINNKYIFKQNWILKKKMYTFMYLLLILVKIGLVNVRI
jgi:hypothetical protein